MTENVGVSLDEKTRRDQLMAGFKSTIYEEAKEQKEAIEARKKEQEKVIEAAKNPVPVAGESKRIRLRRPVTPEDLKRSPYSGESPEDLVANERAGLGGEKYQARTDYHDPELDKTKE